MAWWPFWLLGLPPMVAQADLDAVLLVTEGAQPRAHGTLRAFLDPGDDRHMWSPVPYADKAPMERLTRRISNARHSRTGTDLACPHNEAEPKMVASRTYAARSEGLEPPTF